jgi:hypothetical protein
MTLIAIGAITALGFAALAFNRIRQGKDGLPGLGGILLLVTAGVLVAARALDAAALVPVMIVVAVLLILGIGLLVYERRQVNVTGMANGIASTVTAVLILAAALAMPLIEQGAGAFVGTVEEARGAELLTDVAQARTEVALRSAVPMADASVANFDPDNIQQAEPSPTRAPLEPTVTPTPFTFELPTPVPAVCNGMVMANLNFRVDPTLGADLITVIPAETIINIFDADDSGEWLQTDYQQRRGWVSASVVDLDPECPEAYG